MAYWVRITTGVVLRGASRAHLNDARTPESKAQHDDARTRPVSSNVG